MSLASLLEVMRGRRSIRRYAPTPVPREALEGALDAARWAPSAHNRQPWRFAVITDPMRRAALAEAMGERFRGDLRADGLSAEAVEAQVARSVQRISAAPAVIVVFLSMSDMDHYPDRRRQDAERIMAVQSVALAVQNMLLALHAQGLGACWMCAPLFCPDLVRDALGAPDDWEPQALITVGTPAEQRTRDRDPLDSKVLWT